MSPQRWVLHVDMDAFYASCEQLTRPTLRNRPVLVGGVSGRGVVAGASYEARALGAHSAMPMFHALKLVGFRAVVVQPRRPVYAAASKRVMDILARHAGVVEQLSIDEAFLEPAELQQREPNEVAEWAEDLRHAIREETGLNCSVGAGSGKQFAKIGSGEAKPNGIVVVPRSDEESMLHPLPVGKLWGIGPVSAEKLRSVGVKTIGDFAELSSQEVTAVLGQAVGTTLHQLAKGQDDRPVQPRAIAKQISQEHTYPRDLRTPTEVTAAVQRAAEGAHRRLLKDGRGARTVTVKQRMADFHIESRSHTLSYATDDLATLAGVAQGLARYPSEVGPIRLIGVSLSGLETARQHVLFPELDLEPVHKSLAGDDYEAGVRSPEAESEAQELGDVEAMLGLTNPVGQWRHTQDVRHDEHGHGWVQGSGHGVVSVRFETRSTGPGRALTLAVDDPALHPADPLDSLDWDEWISKNVVSEHEEGSVAEGELDSHDVDVHADEGIDDALDDALHGPTD